MNSVRRRLYTYIEYVEYVAESGVEGVPWCHIDPHQYLLACKRRQHLCTGRARVVLCSPVLSGVAAETGRFGLAGSFIDGNSPFLCNFVVKGPLLLLQDGHFVCVLELWINTFDPRASALALTTV